MKFLSLFFLLLFVFVFRGHSATYPAKLKGFAVADTIIQLDSVKGKKLLKKKRSTKLNDTLNVRPMKTLKDTSKKKKDNEVDAEIKYVSRDSSRADNVNKILYLWGNARVTYDGLELDADYIKVDQKNHLVYASGLPDPKTGKYANRPIFKQKDDKPIIADSLVFNYITKKGKIYNAATEEGGNYVSGGTAKRLNSEEVAYHNVLFSTCDLPYPATHFGIVITKGIAEKHHIISGPAYIEIEGVPLPLILPFGFFPKPDSKSSGFILPTFGEDQSLGFYLKGFGYYVTLGDYADFTTTGTYYTKGSYAIYENARYLKRYSYQGSVNLGFASTKGGLETDPANTDFNIQWSHTQDPASHPGTTFSASVNAGTASYFQNTRAQTTYNLTALTQNQLHSSIAYGKTWAGSPFNLTVNLSHSQDLTAKTVQLELPTFSLSMTTLSPFDSKDRVGEQKWYQKITVGYSLQGTNKLSSIPENQLFTSTTFSKRFQNGFSQNIPIALSLNVLKYFQFNTSLNYNERDYFQTIRKHYARGSISGSDSLVVDTVQGFRRAGDYSISSGFSTKVYSTILFKKGNLKAIRHVMTPSVSFQYRPDYSSNDAYYKTIVSNATIPYPTTSQVYSIFEQAVYGGPSGTKSAGLAISLDNTIEAKLAAKSSDTSGTERKVPLLQGLSVSTFYNFLADSLRLSTISFSGRTAIFNQKLGISFGGSLNPYVNQVRDSISNNQVVRYSHIINRYTFQDGYFPTLSTFNLSMDFSFNSSNIGKKTNKNPASQQVNTLSNMDPQAAARLAQINSNPNAYVDFNIPWNISMSYSFFYSNTGVSTSTTNTVNFNGDLSVTPKWKIQYTSGYDIRAQKFSTTSISIYRDLHCWDLSFQWIPFGYYKFYSVDLKVKASILQDLKLSKRKDYYNNY